MLITALVVLFLLTVTSLLVRANSLNFRYISISCLSLLAYYVLGGNLLYLFLYSSVVTFFLSKNLHKSKFFLLLNLFLVLSPVIFLKINAFVNLAGDIRGEILNKSEKSNTFISIIVSSYLLQLVSYQVDIYRDKAKLIKNPYLFFGVSSFFSNLFNGPILSYSKLNKKVSLSRPFSHDQALSGVALVIFGLMKKKIVIEHLIPLFNNLFNLKNPSSLSLLAVCLSPVFVFLEYSALIDIIRGVGKIYNFEIENCYQSPLSKKGFTNTLVGFNKSFSVWIRIYIFRPLCKLANSNLDIFFWNFLIFFFIGVILGNGTKYLFFSVFCFVFFEFEQLLFTSRKKNNFEKNRSYLSFFQRPFGILGITIASLIFLSPSVGVSLVILKSLAYKNINIFTNESFQYFNFEIMFTTMFALSFVFVEVFRSKVKLLFIRFPVVVRWFCISISCVVLLLFYSKENMNFLFF